MRNYLEPSSATTEALYSLQRSGQGLPRGEERIALAIQTHLIQSYGQQSITALCNSDRHVCNESAPLGKEELDSSVRTIEAPFVVLSGATKACRLIPGSAPLKLTLASSSECCEPRRVHSIQGWRRQSIVALCNKLLLGKAHASRSTGGGYEYAPNPACLAKTCRKDTHEMSWRYRLTVEMIRSTQSRNCNALCALLKVATKACQANLPT